MGPYYDFISMIALGITPPPPGRPRLGSPGRRAPTLRPLLTRVWGWIKPRPGDLPTSLGQFPARWDPGSHRHGQPDMVRSLLR